ncbi:MULTISPECIES: NERD domain-containing protein [Frankia]|uniref:NERD domain-containing protein n=1 Tax=Frankia TaxID=1854 RepID=UPI000ABA079D|nr:MULTISPECIES: NERD domain-containing protein [Frankia]
MLLPDAEPYRAWSNFTFTATTGHIREVDLLVVARGGVYLIEIKSLVGRLTAAGSNWTQHRDSGNTRIFDNPLHLANQKSKELRSLLENAGRASRTKIPFIQPAVFLSNPTLRVELPDHQLHWVFGPERGAPGGAAERNADGAGRGGSGGRGGVALPSIWSGLLDAPLRDERQRITPALSKALATLLATVGIARSRRHQQVGSWQLEFPAFDSGPTWQDHHAAHAQVASERRRVRIYLVERATGEAERANREAVARREFLVLHGIDHPGIVQVDGLESHEAGPALIFRHRPDEMRLDHYLDRFGDRLDAGTRLRMIRQLAEAVAYAHGRHLYHRALAARSVLVVPSGGRGWLAPNLMISDWQAAARDAGSGTGALTNAMTTTSRELAVEPAGPVPAASGTGRRRLPGARDRRPQPGSGRHRRVRPGRAGLPDPHRAATRGQPERAEGEAGAGGGPAPGGGRRLAVRSGERRGGAGDLPAARQPLFQRRRAARLAAARRGGAHPA